MRQQALLLILLASPLLAAAPNRSELAADGTIYSLLGGSFGELFPGDPSHAADNPVLAVDLIAPDGSSERLLVSGTAEGRDPETVSSLVVSPAATFVVWEHLIEGVFSELLMARYSPVDGWSEPLRVAVHPFNRKSTPLLTVTQSDFRSITDAGAVELHDRTILHVVWSEQSGLANKVLYVPVVVVDGELPEDTPPWVILNSLLPALEPGTDPAAPEIYGSVWVRAGDDAHRLVVSFADEATRQLASVEVYAVPGELGALADRARAQIGGYGNAFVDLPDFAERARAQIGGYGSALRLHPGVVGYLADSAAGELLAADPLSIDFAELGSQARLEIIRLGSKLLSRPVDGSRLFEGAASESTTLLEVRSLAGSQLLRAEVASVYPLLEGSEQGMELLSSDDGHSLLVAWPDRDGRRLSYSLGTQGIWREPTYLAIDEARGVDAAFQLLQQLIDHY